MNRFNRKPSSALPERREGPYLRRPWKSGAQRLLPILLGGAVVFSLFSLILGNRGLAHLWELAWQERELRNELDNLEREAENLRWEQGETGAMAIERPAREKFDMQRPGEIVYYFPREGTDGARRIEAQTARQRNAEPDLGKSVDKKEGDR